MPITLLAIESSCDDTSAAVLQDGRLLSNVVASQTVHEAYGGVVPELASRAHQQHIVPVVHQALVQAGIQKKQLNAIAFTSGPGLIGSLFVGATFAKALALGLDVPLIAVNHMRAHVLAHFIDEPKPQFPFLCLTVSGGHTQIVKVNNYLDMQIVGESSDDAAGEAFDKTAKLLGLPYPGGPLLDQYAQLGNPLAFTFPEGKSKEPFGFSFSGLKTSVLYFLQKNTQLNPDFIAQNRNDICASVQKTIVSVLLKRLKAAAKYYGITHLAISGGVSANSALRKEFEAMGKRMKWQTYIPQFQYCTDNAGMIAMSAWYQYLAADFTDQSAVPQARAPIGR